MLIVLGVPLQLTSEWTQLDGCIHYKESSCCLQELQTHASSTALLPTCHFLVRWGTEGRSLSFSCPLHGWPADSPLWLLSLQCDSGRADKVYLTWGTERKTSKASCYSYQVFPPWQSPTLSSFLCSSVRRSPWVRQLGILVLIIPCPLLRGPRRGAQGLYYGEHTRTPTRRACIFQV